MEQIKAREVKVGDELGWGLVIAVKHHHCVNDIGQVTLGIAHPGLIGQLSYRPDDLVTITGRDCLPPELESWKTEGAPR